jgi:hypothetical protein
MNQSDVAKELGFTDEKEMFHLISRVLIDTPERMAKFKDWQFNDGTKAGLMKLEFPEASRCWPAAPEYKSAVGCKIVDMLEPLEE